MADLTCGCRTDAAGIHTYRCFAHVVPEPVLTRAEAGEHVRAALKLATEATNALACVARAKYQHAEVTRLHHEIKTLLEAIRSGGRVDYAANAA